jgi:hypothetical protein
VSGVRVSCPSCGGAVNFAVGTGVVAVCPYCRSVVARGDQKVEDLGKVAALVETGAVLTVGLTGQYQGVAFQLTGRTQLGHEAGGVWDEWYAAFSDGRWGWLAEAHGVYYLTFQRTDVPGNRLPALDNLRIGHPARLPLDLGRLVVDEKGTARVQGAEGEIPYRLTPGATYAYADLSGPRGEFATLDYGDTPPSLYLGVTVTLDELKIPKSARREVWNLREVQGKALSCPHCGGPLELRAPDRTERVGCPHCGAMLDATQGELRLLQPPGEAWSAPTPVLPLGSVGRLGGDERLVIGMIQRSVTFDGVDYFWEEYLLYHPRDGFEWLVRSDDHWSRVHAVPAGTVTVGAGTQVAYQGGMFTLFQRARATVTAVLGECYWKVERGEQVLVDDYVAPPEILSREATAGAEAGSGEVNWSLGIYLSPAEVEKGFALKQPLPRPSTVGPNQPFPYTGVYVYYLWLLLVLGVLGLLALVRPAHTAYEWEVALEPLPAGSKSQVVFSDKFDLKGWRNVRVTADCPTLANGWLFIEGDLIEDANGHMQPFGIPFSYYSGVDEGEAWHEGSHEDSAYLSAQPAGRYSLRLEVEREKGEKPERIRIKVEQGAARMWDWLMALILLSLLPLGVACYHLWFSIQRWKDSQTANVSASGESSSGGDED